MKNKTLLKIVFLLVISQLSSCKAILLIYTDIHHRLPSKEELKKNYAARKKLYDSIAELSFQVFDLPKARNSCLSYIFIEKPPEYYWSTDTASCIEHDPKMIDRNEDSLLADPTYKSLIFKILLFSKKAKVPRYQGVTVITRNLVEISYKRVLETFKDDYYVNYYYVRNGEPLGGDTIARNVYTNRNDFLKH